MPGFHSKYSPSKLARIIACPGSVALNADVEEKESSYAAEGTMLHKVTEKSIPTGELSQALIAKYNLTQEHIDAVKDVLDFIATLKMSHDETPWEAIELEVSMAPYGKLYSCAGLEHVAGTLDYLLAFPQERIMYIIDWKFGQGIEVFPDTPQLKAYAMGALADFKGNDWYMNSLLYEKIVMVIGQPRIRGNDHFKLEIYTPAELMEWLHGPLIPAINAAEAGMVKLHPSEVACRWCRVKSTCKARRDFAVELAETVFSTYAKLPSDVSKEEITALLPKAKELRAYLADLEAYAVQQIMAGEDIPGFKLVAGRSLRGWKNSKDMLTFTDCLGYSEMDMSTVKLMSPAQAEKKLGKKISKETKFQNLIHKPEGKPTLVPEADKREALHFKTAEDTFTSYT